MKKKLIGLLLIACLTASMDTTAYGETSYGDPDWNVAFTEGKKMESNFKTSDIDEAIYGMQPGDNAIIELTLENQNTETTNWYMTNEVLYSLEDRSTNKATGGGAYTYKLQYTDKDGKTETLFNSDTVGGEEISAAGEGLHGATDALEDFFYLDTLTKGQKGHITLEVALDGETQGNDYQDTLADLAMDFAVELGTSPPSTPNRPSGNTPRPGTPAPQRSTERLDDPSTPTAIVQTGDDTILTPYIIAAAISGGILLIFALYSTASRQKQRKHKKIVPFILIALCLTDLPAVQVQAAEGDYTYTIRFFSGAQGTIDGKEVLVKEGLHAGERVTFSQRQVTLNDNSKYYVKGIRESGRDNNTANSASSFPVTGDMDYVVVYGLLADAVSYTVNYVNTAGETLRPSETYYGNVGDEPVISYIYIDGYQPQAYNLTGRLKKNAADNVFDFVYTAVSSGTVSPPATPWPTTAPIVPRTTTAPAAPGAPADQTGGETGTGGTDTTGTDTDTDEGPDAGDGGDGTADTGGNEEAGPQELQRIDDEEAPLANTDLGMDDAVVDTKEFATLLMDLPLAAKVGLSSALLLAAGAAAWFLLKRKKRKTADG